MVEMTPRRRVEEALNYQEPDRVPTALWGGPYGIVDELYLALVDELELGEPVEPFRTGHNVSYLDDRVLERLGTDTRYVWPGDSPSSPKPRVPGSDRLFDGYGQPWNMATPYYYPDRGLLAEASIDDIDRLVTWPDPADPGWTAGVRERARALKEDTEYYVVGRMVTSHGVFQTSGDLRGMEQFLMDLIVDEAFATTLVERVTDTIDGLLSGYLEAGGEYFDMIELPGDDYGTSQNLIMSPAMFRRHFKPALKRLIDTVKTFRPDLRVMFHSDGVIHELIPDLIEIGVDALHPLEPLPAMDLEQIKADHGDEIAFIGAIDIVRAMTGTQEDVIEEVLRRVHQLAPGGGYILAPANHLQADVPAGNVTALYEAARRFGTYPIAPP